MALDPADLPSAAVDFMTERHLATLTTLRRDGSPHVVPVGFTWDREERVARVMLRVLGRNPDAVFLIAGYTDAVGSDEDNASLSDRRAEAVAEVLTEEFDVPTEPERCDV